MSAPGEKTSWNIKKCLSREGLPRYDGELRYEGECLVDMSQVSTFPRYLHLMYVNLPNAEKLEVLKILNSLQRAASSQAGA